MIRKKDLIEKIDYLEHKLDVINEKLDKVLKKTPKNEKNYDLSGVPEYQLNYINDILEADKTK